MVGDDSAAGGIDLLYRRDSLRAALLAAATRPFLVLSGRPGTGKTQLCRRLASLLTKAPSSDYSSPFDELLAQLDTPTDSGPFRVVPNHPDMIAVKAAFDPRDSAALDSPVHERRVAFLPVRPDWTNASALWGHFDAQTGRFMATDALVVLLNAYRCFLRAGAAAPIHVIILDELNLARVEHYLSDLLSLMEAPCEEAPDSSGTIRLGETTRIHPMETSVVSRGLRARSRMEPAQPNAGDPTPNSPSSAQADPLDQRVPLVEFGAERWLYEPLVRGWGQARRPETQGTIDDRHALASLFPIPPHIACPPNILLMGTLNLDSTTLTLSPKVLDRAFLLEADEPNHEALRALAKDCPTTASLVDMLVTTLGPAGLCPGYRIAEEMEAMTVRAGGVMSASLADLLISGRVLPTLGGRGPQVGSAIEALLEACSQGFDGLAELPKSGDVLPRSAKRLRAMKAGLDAQGELSYFD